MPLVRSVPFKRGSHYRTISFLLSRLAEFYCVSLNTFQVQETFQLVLSTDGQASFAAFVYDSPETILSHLNEFSNSRIGFDVGLLSPSSVASVDIGLLVEDSNLTFTSTNIYRIDGKDMEITFLK